MSSIMRDKVDTVNQFPGRQQRHSGGGDAPDDVLEAVHGLMHLVRARQQQAAAGPGGEPGLSPLEGRVLGFFARHPGATQRDLAEHSGRDKGQLARLLTGLRAQGLLDAEADPADGRVTRLRLSAAAQAQHRALQAQRQRLAAVAVAGFSGEEKQALLGLLARVRQNLEAAD
jgi:DNA-binding MarR family transcriptional regulator